MRIRRDIASIPVRSAKETWRAIIDLVVADSSVDRGQLDAASSVMEALIAGEQPATAPIVFKGYGPRVLIYCVYNEGAMEAGHDIDRLNANPTVGDWRVTAPCAEGDVSWMNETLRDRAPRARVYAANDQPSEDEERTAGSAAKPIEIDWRRLGKS